MHIGFPGHFHRNIENICTDEDTGSCIECVTTAALGGNIISDEDGDPNYERNCVWIRILHNNTIKTISNIAKSSVLILYKNIFDDYESPPQQYNKSNQCRVSFEIIVLLHESIF